MVPIEKLAPDWGTLVDAGYWSRECFNGLSLLQRTSKVELESYWNHETILGPLVLTSGGMVVARGFNKIYSEGMEAFPESNPANWPVDGDFELSRMYDGVLGLWLRDVWGQTHVVAETGLQSPDTKWATEYARRVGRNADWPLRYTPVVEILRSERPSVVIPDGSELRLIGMVDLETGFALPHSALELWARQFGLRCETMLPERQETLDAEPRGYIATLNLDIGVPPIKVKHENEAYLKSKRLMQKFSQHTLWERFHAGDENFHRTIGLDREYPVRWRRWLFVQGKQLHDKFAELDKRIDQILKEVPETLTSNSARMHWLWSHHSKEFPAAYAKFLKRDTEYRKLLWDKVGQDAEQVPYLP
jgi:hypothetical protein